MEEMIYSQVKGIPSHALESALPILPALTQHVARVTCYRARFDEAAMERLVPDGAARLIFALDKQRSFAFVAGPSARPALLRLEGEVATLTITLHPGAAGQCLRVAASSLRDQCFDLRELWPAAATRSSAALAKADDRPARVSQIVQSALAVRLADADANARRRVAFARRALASGQSVADTAARLGVGERRLQQLFDAELGLAPRQVGRLARLHACLRALNLMPRMSLAQLAHELGFFDQAHMTSELSKLLGLTPTSYIAAVSASSKTGH